MAAIRSKSSAKRFNLAVTSEDEALVAMLGRVPLTPGPPETTAEASALSPSSQQAVETTSHAPAPSDTEAAIAVPSETAVGPTVSGLTADDQPRASGDKAKPATKKRAAARDEMPSTTTALELVRDTGSSVAPSRASTDTPAASETLIVTSAAPTVNEARTLPETFGVTAATVGFYQTLRGKDRYIYLLLYNVTVNAGTRYWQGRLSDFCRLYQETFGETLSEETARRQFGRLEALRLVQRHYIPGDQRGMMYECASFTEAGHAPELQAEMEWLLRAKGLQ